MRDHDRHDGLHGGDHDDDDGVDRAAIESRKRSFILAALSGGALATLTTACPEPCLSSCIDCDEDGIGATGGTGGSGGAGGAGGATGGGGEGGETGLLIDPIELGYTWTYDVQSNNYPLCPSGSHTAEAISEAVIDGKDAVEVTSLCAEAPSSFYSVDGDTVYVQYMDEWVLALEAPVEEGHTWSNGISTFTWSNEGTVDSAAGTFTDCWRATQNVDYTAYTVFCRGVGPVHWRVIDLSGNGFDAFLTDKNF